MTVVNKIRMIQVNIICLLLPMLGLCEDMQSMFDKDVGLTERELAYVQVCCLNLNGYTLANSANWHGPLEIATDCTVKNGTIRNNSLTGDALVTITGGNVVFEDVTFDCSNCTPQALVRIAFGCKANVTFKGNCRFLAANKNVDAVYVDYCTSGKVTFDSSFTGYVGGKVTLAYESTHPNDDPAVEVSIAGSGTFENAIALDGGAYTFNNSSVSISGGRFATAPNSNCLATDMQQANGADGYWLVIPVGSPVPGPIFYIENGVLKSVDLNGFNDIAIPEGVRSIGDMVFLNCASLTGVTIPNSVTNIGVAAFSGCSGLAAVTIPDGVKTIADYAFNRCSGLKSVVIPDSIRSIGLAAFYGCAGLTEISLPDNLTIIGNNAFQNCSGLRSLAIPDAVTTIGDYAFYGCSGLGGVTIGSGVMRIGGYAFNGCSGLTSVLIPGNVADIGQYAFWNCSGLTGISISEGVANIGDAAFRECNGLKCVTLPNSVTNIGMSVFYSCTGLTNAIVGNGVARIAYGAFSSCSRLVDVTIGVGVERIENYAFYGCGQLARILFEGDAPSVSGANAFPSSNADCTIYVLTDSSGWGVDIPGMWNDVRIAYADVPSTQTYAASFNANGGLGTMPQQLFANGVAQALASNRFERKHYSFGGWALSADGAPFYSDGEVVTLTDNITLFAKWQLKSYKVSYVSNGGYPSSGYGWIPALTPLSTWPLLQVTKEGYEFDGWFTKEGVPAKDTILSGDLTLYAHWSDSVELADTYTIEFHPNGGKIGSATTRMVIVQKGKAVGTLPKATRKGYKLKGWYTKKSGGTKVTTKTKVMNNVTYYAQWTANKYKIKFNKNGGKGTMKTLSATYGKNVKLTANAFRRTGYKFAGWAKKKNGKVAYKNKAKVKNLTATNGKTVTIYAVWKKAKSSSVKEAATAANSAKSAAVSAAVPAWAVGTFCGGDGGAFTTITVSKVGKVSGKVLFADGKWTIVGKAVGQRLETVVTDAGGNSAEVVFVIVKTPDGRCRIESEDGSIWAE